MTLMIRERKNACLQFMADPDPPFTINLANQTVHMTKLHREVIGCFLTGISAGRFVCTRSRMDTVRKEGCDILESLRPVLDPSIPNPTPHQRGLQRPCSGI